MKKIDGWNEINLDAVIAVIQSGSRPKGGASSDRGDIPSLGGENIITAGGVTLRNVKLVPFDFYNRMTKGHLHDADVLINKDGAQTGKVGYYRAPANPAACINEHLFLIRGKVEQIKQKYLYYCLLFQGGQDQIRSQVSGSAQPGLKSGFIKGIAINLPDSLSEQATIAEVLSTLDEAIEQTEALIAKHKRLKAGLMQDLLTCGIDEHGKLRSERTHQFKDSPSGKIPIEWASSQIGNVATLQRGYDITENELRDGPYPVISSSGVIGYHAEYTSNGPNVVVGRKGTIGKVHFIESNLWAHDTSLFVTNFKGNNERFVYHMFQYLELAKYGTKSGSPSLNRNDIHPIWIGLPSPDEQSQISILLVKYERELGAMTEQLGKLHSLKIALMLDLLTGKKRVTALLNDIKAIPV